MAVGAGDFGADMRADAGLFRGHVEASGTGDVVAVKDGKGREVERGGAGDQLFRDGGALEKTESAAGVEFDIRWLVTGGWWLAICGCAFASR